MGRTPGSTLLGRCGHLLEETVTKTLLTWLGALVMVSLVRTPDQVEPCGELYGVLEDVPHVSLARRAGQIDPIWSGEPAPDCQIEFETNDSTLNGATVPIFLAEPGSDEYRAGWRLIPEIIADGAGSGIHGIQRAPLRCVIRWEQPAYIADDGTFVESDTLTMLIQCRSSAGT